VLCHEGGRCGMRRAIDEAISRVAEIGLCKGHLGNPSFVVERHLVGRAF
jgi:hypothetical protein